MSRWTVRCAVLAVAGCAILGASGSAKAQQVIYGQPQSVPGFGYTSGGAFSAPISGGAFSAPISGGALSAPISAGGIVQGPEYPAEPRFPYSYYAAYPSPAREYVPYGQNDIFPFDGRAYGHAYDRYSWVYMAGYNDLLSRYYYPPLR